jgi:hypothetical protein
VFAAAIFFHPSILIAAMARSLPLERSPVRLGLLGQTLPIEQHVLDTNAVKQLS